MTSIPKDASLYKYADHDKQAYSNLSCQNVDFATCVFLLIDFRYKHGVVVVRLEFLLGLLATFLFVIVFFLWQIKMIMMRMMMLNRKDGVNVQDLRFEAVVIIIII